MRIIARNSAVPLYALNDVNAIASFVLVVLSEILREKSEVLLL